MRRRKDRLDSLLKDYYQRERGTVAEDSMDMVYERRPLLREMRMPSMIYEAVARKKEVSHPTLSLLGAYIDGTLDEKEKAEIHRHIEECPDCRDKVRSGLESIRDYKEGKLTKTDEKLSSETASRLDDYHRKSSPPPRRRKGDSKTPV